MLKKSDDSIERFFRKAVSQQDLSHREADWKNMEKLLDEHAVAAGTLKVRAIKKIATYSVIAILASLSTYVALVRPWKFSAVKNLEANSASIKNQEVKPSQAAAGMLSPQSGTKVNPSADLLFSESKSATQNFENRSTKTDAIKELTASQPSNTHIVSSDKSLLISGLNTDSQPETVAWDDSADITLRSESPVAAGAERTFKSALNGNEYGTPVTENVDTNDSVGVAEQVQKVDGIDDEKEDEETSAIKLPGRWSVGVVIAPDFSSTSLGRYSAPGASFGLLVSYRALPRWQLSTGLIKSFKQYEGYGDEYQPPPGYWENRTNGIVPDEVAGNCGIVEWPILLRYDFLAKERGRAFVSAGVSSYLMRSESYTYRFAQENPGAASGWTASKPTSYSFGIGHLSAGYEKSFSKGVSVAIEPYFKIPFGTIGWTNISLHSTGAYLTVRYTFLKKSEIPTTQTNRQ